MAAIPTVLFIVLSLSLSHHYYEVEGGKTLSEEEDLELERQLKILNKPPIKTIQTEVGDIFDCIDIHKQPAFDHPLLKNHKIQMKPSSRPKNSIDETSSASEHSNIELISCPEGTVPIRRTQKEDLIRAKSFSNSYVANAHLDSNRIPGAYRALVQTKYDPSDRYFGARAFINIYNPRVRAGQSSSAQIWIQNGPMFKLNSIQVGWTVNPHLFGDNKTRIFIFWAGKGNEIGCFNNLCPGFVQVSKQVIIGAYMKYISTYGGTQYNSRFYIFQDPYTKYWWLQIENIDVGYWPKNLLPHLLEGTNHVGWGGLARGPPHGSSPPMGSGHFPADRTNHHACFFRQLEIVNQYDNTIAPNANLLESFEDTPKCYRLHYYGYQGHIKGLTFLFGGPGGFCWV